MMTERSDIGIQTSSTETAISSKQRMSQKSTLEKELVAHYGRDILTSLRKDGHCILGRNCRLCETQICTFFNGFQID